MNFAAGAGFAGFVQGTSATPNFNPQANQTAIRLSGDGAGPTASPFGSASQMGSQNSQTGAGRSSVLLLELIIFITLRASTL